jgi:hypothetical protein
MVPGPALKCQSPADVYLLLKSSDFISHDLDHAFDGCVDYDPATVVEEELVQATSKLSVEGSSDTDSDDDDGDAPPRKRLAKQYPFELVLKQWYDMPKSQEWRCFVRDRKLVGESDELHPPCRRLTRKCRDIAT